MNRTAAKASALAAAAFLILCAMLFLPAGTLAYWHAWAYLAVLFVTVSLFLPGLLQDPEFLERRLRLKEKDPGQALIIKLGTVCYALAFIVPGLDRRFGWSRVPVAVVAAADVLVLLGYAFVLRVFKKNRFASRIVEVQPGQRVIATGPYAVVRHPMYLGMLVVFLSTPLALGSWWALIPASSLITVLSFRIRGEERLLEKDLEGYREYMRVTRYRLIPGVW